MIFHGRTLEVTSSTSGESKKFSLQSRIKKVIAWPKILASYSLVTSILIVRVTAVIQGIFYSFIWEIIRILGFTVYPEIRVLTLGSIIKQAMSILLISELYDLRQTSGPSQK